MTKKIEQEVPSDVVSETMFVGALYKDTELFLQYEGSINSKYFFHDPVTKFYYVQLSTMLKNFATSTSEETVNMFMMQDDERFKTYQSYGGYSFIQLASQAANPKDADKYLDNIIKFALLREYYRKGYDIEKIKSWDNFDQMTSENVANAIQAMADNIYTKIVKNKRASVLNNDMTSFVKRLAIAPQVGLELPFPTLHSMFRGMRLGKMIACGMLSNEGKSRFMTALYAKVCLLQNEKVLILANEMSEEDIKAALLVSIINDQAFQSVHKLKIKKPENEIALGLYRDDNTHEFIARNYDEWDDTWEDEDKYIERLFKSSAEFRAVMAVSKWIDERIDTQIYFKELEDYSDKQIIQEIKRYYTYYGVKYFAYDTLKNYGAEDWGTLKQTTTKLKEIANKLKVFIWASIQLTDDSYFTSVFDLSSNNIASSKQMKHVLDHLIYAVRLPKEKYDSFIFRPHDKSWGDIASLDKTKTYYAIKVDKNRGGSKDLYPLLEVNLDYNTWVEIGTVTRGNSRSSKE